MDQKKHFLQGAAILAAAGIISKALGALYRIPLARWLGAEGIGLYQMAYPFYTTILSLTTAGIPVAISILVARKENAGLNGDSYKILRASFYLLLVIGLVLSVLFYFGADFIARSGIKQPKAVLPLMALAPAIFFAAMMTVYRGFFQGQQWMIPTAVSQVVEQIFRVVFILILAYLLLSRGLEVAVAGATFGAVVGGFAGLLTLVGFYTWYRNKITIKKQLVYSGQSSWSLGKEMLRLAIPVSLGAVVLPLTQMLDTFIVPRRLIESGYTVVRATELYGELSGMASTLINLPIILIVAIAASLVPAVTEALVKKDTLVLNNRINESIRASLLIALPSAVGLYVLADQIMDLLYSSTEAGIPLAFLSFSVLVIAIFQVTSSGLQGLGKPGIPMRHLIITGLLKVLLNYSLTAAPLLNIRGPAIATFIAFSIGSVLNIIYLVKLTGIRFEWARYIKLILITIVMGIIVKISYQVLVIAGIPSKASTVIAIVIGVTAFGGGLFVFKELDWNMFKGLKHFN
ncbi:MAG: putative polysaccharide biosynthesis protein [Chitinophagales bacterium]